MDPAINTGQLIIDTVINVQIKDEFKDQIINLCTAMTERNTWFSFLLQCIGNGLVYIDDDDFTRFFGFVHAV